MRSAPQRGVRRSFLRLVVLVARRDYLRTIRRRGFVFGTVLLPAAVGGFVMLSSLAAPTFEPRPGSSSRLAIVNESALRLTPPSGSDAQLLTRSDAERSLEQGRLREFYLIPADYPAEPLVQRILAPGAAPGLDDIQRRLQQERVLASILRASLIDEEDIPPTTVERLLDPYQLADENGGDAPPIPGFEAGFVLPYAFTFLFVMSIFITSGYLLQSVTEEKENRVVEILLSSVPPLPLMAGKILGLGAAGLTQVSAWILSGVVGLPLLGERLPQLADLELKPLTIALAVTVFVLGYLAYGAIFAAIGAIAPGTREAQQYSGFFGFFAVVPLIFAGAFVADLNSPVVLTLTLLPLTAPAATLQLLALSSEPPLPLVFASLLSLAAFAGVATVVAARIFRATLLLYGVRPSLGRILAAVTARD